MARHRVSLPERRLPPIVPVDPAVVAGAGTVLPTATVPAAFCPPAHNRDPMEFVTSADGTRIAYDRGGEGPPLVLVHGTTSDHVSWERVLPDLRERFTVYAMDRRGRGGSGDAEDYSIEREFEDVAAVCAAVDGPVNLVGHSYGALCSLGAAPSIPGLRRLVLYEPPLFTEAREGPTPALLDRMDEQLAAGENEAILETFFRDVTDAGDRLELYRAQPSWSMRVAAAPTVPREVRAIATFEPDPADYADLDVPTLVLLGSETREELSTATRRAADLFPNAELHVLEGEGHAAMYTAPETLVSTVTAFLTDGD